jgi:hypothetical protein
MPPSPPSAPLTSFRASFVYAYEMYSDDARISVSLGTVQLEPEGDGTRLTYTEQGAYLDGLDVPEQREEGTGALLDALGAELSREPAKD